MEIVFSSPIYRANSSLFVVIMNMDGGVKIIRMASSAGNFGAVKWYSVIPPMASFFLYIQQLPSFAHGSSEWVFGIKDNWLIGIIIAVCSQDRYLYHVPPTHLWNYYLPIPLLHLLTSKLFVLGQNRWIAERRKRVVFKPMMITDRLYKRSEWFFFSFFRFLGVLLLLGYHESIPPMTCFFSEVEKVRSPPPEIENLELHAGYEDIKKREEGERKI